jgi:hypothetical protein
LSLAYSFQLKEVAGAFSRNRPINSVQADMILSEGSAAISQAHHKSGRSGQVIDDVHQGEKCAKCSAFVPMIEDGTERCLASEKCNNSTQDD